MDNIEEKTKIAEDLIKGLLKDPKKYKAVKAWTEKYSFVLKRALKLSDQDLEDIKGLIDSLKEESEQ